MITPVENITQIHSKLAEGKREFRSLVAVRDAVLPKLTSGRLRVSNDSGSLRSTHEDRGGPHPDWSWCLTSEDQGKATGGRSASLRRGGRLE